MTLGGSDRISMWGLFEWIDNKKTLPLDQFLRDVFSELVFSQHMRVALARFDGQVQRLRFVLGDTGIVPTASAMSTLASYHPPWMADRLDAFVNLLCDLDIVNMDDEGRLKIGENAGYLQA